MNVRDWIAQQRALVFDALQRGDEPPVGEFDLNLLQEARRVGRVQQGSTTYEPDAIRFEFIYSGSNQATVILEVRVPTPQRVVYMAVPEWVIESIWQGEVSGSYHFESDAHLLLKRFESSLSLEENRNRFHQKPKLIKG